MMNTIYDMGIFRANGPYGNFLIWFGALEVQYFLVKSNGKTRLFNFCQNGKWKDVLAIYSADHDSYCI